MQNYADTINSAVSKIALLTDLLTGTDQPLQGAARVGLCEVLAGVEADLAAVVDDPKG